MDFHCSRDGRQSREFDLGHFGMSSGELRHECRLAKLDVSDGYFDEREARTFPTDGNPTNPTDAIPVLATSNPTPAPPPPPPEDGEISSRRSFASFALS